MIGRNIQFVGVRHLGVERLLLQAHLDRFLRCQAASACSIRIRNEEKRIHAKSLVRGLRNRVLTCPTESKPSAVNGKLELNAHGLLANQILPGPLPELNEAGSSFGYMLASIRISPDFSERLCSEV